MNSVERFYKTINKEPVDRPACWLGLPEVHALPCIYKYFNVNDMCGLKRKIDDDIYPVEMPYDAPNSKAIYAAFDFAKEGNYNENERTLTAPGFFEDIEEPERVDEFNWPDPEKYISPDECIKLVESVPEGKVVMGVLWSAHFQDTCAAFGMEMALMNMLVNPEVYKAVDNKIVDFYLRANKVFYEATKGKVHAVLIGNDMGSQNCLMLSPELIREFVIPGTKKLIEQAKSYGIKVFYHSCGAIADIIPDLIEAGVDVIHPIQALATGMEPKGLKEKFGNSVAFCGGVDAQHLLVNGTPEQVRQKVKELKEIFPTGLIISPSHEAILKDIAPENIEALLKEVKGE